LASDAVVVAEDDPDVRNGLVYILQREYDVVAAVENGEQLLNALQRFRPGLAVIDVSMPVLNGLEALREIQAKEIEVKAVMVSANADPAYVREALRLGALGYVLKSSAVEELSQALRAASKSRTLISRGIRFPRAGENWTPNQ